MYGLRYWRISSLSDMEDIGFVACSAGSPARVREVRATRAYLTAPRARRIDAIWLWPRRCAQASGVAQGSSSGRLVGAPRAMRNSTIAAALARAAQASGVDRYSSSRAAKVAAAA